MLVCAAMSSGTGLDGDANDFVPTATTTPPTTAEAPAPASSTVPERILRSREARRGYVRFPRRRRRRARAGVSNCAAPPPPSRGRPPRVPRPRPPRDGHARVVRRAGARLVKDDSVEGVRALRTSPPRISRPCRRPERCPRARRWGRRVPARTGTRRRGRRRPSAGRGGSCCWWPGGAASGSSRGKILVPTVDQNANVAALAPITPYTNLPLTESVWRCTGSLRCCAASNAAHDARHLGLPSPPLLTTRTVNAGVTVHRPGAHVVARGLRARDAGCRLWSPRPSALVPRTTTPSTGTRSPMST